MVEFRSHVSERHLTFIQCRGIVLTKCIMAYSVFASHAVSFYHCWGQQCQRGEMCKRVICIYDKTMFDKTIFDKNISFTRLGSIH